MTGEILPIDDRSPVEPPIEGQLVDQSALEIAPAPFQCQPKLCDSCPIAREAEGEVIVEAVGGGYDKRSVYIDMRARDQAGNTTRLVRARYITADGGIGSDEEYIAVVALGDGIQNCKHPKGKFPFRRCGALASNMADYRQG